VGAYTGDSEKGRLGTEPMTDIRILLAKAQEQGATFIPGEGDELKVRAPAPLPQDLVEELKEHKAEILALLHSGIKPELVGTVPVEGQRMEAIEVREGETIQAVKICSHVLEDEIWLNLDRSFIPHDGLACYYPEEISELQIPLDGPGSHRADLAELREVQDKVEQFQNQLVLEPMRKLLVSLKENGSSHPFFIMQQAWGALDWDEVVEMMNSILEALAGLHSK